MSKIQRVLWIWGELNKGKVVSKKMVENHYKTDFRTIQRDFAEIRKFLSDNKDNRVLEYSYKKSGYVLTQCESPLWFTDEEVLSLSKILLESRAYKKDEVELVIEKLLRFCNPSNRKDVQDMIRNEQFHYVAPRHNKELFGIIWELSKAIKNQKVVELTYYRKYQDDYVMRKVEPLGVIFSEFYFYLIASIEGMKFDYPTIYRIDRIDSYLIREETFRVNYVDRFQEGEFRKRIQFMSLGKLMKIKFLYSGYDLDSIIDRLPTAEIVEKKDEGYVIETEIFGRGVKMWLLSQGQRVEVLEPLMFRNEFIGELKQINEKYESQNNSK